MVGKNQIYTIDKKRKSGKTRPVFRHLISRILCWTEMSSPEYTTTTRSSGGEQEDQEKASPSTSARGPELLGKAKEEEGGHRGRLKLAGGKTFVCEKEENIQHVDCPHVRDEKNVTGGNAAMCRWNRWQRVTARKKK